MIFFSIFCWLWNFLLQNLKLKKNWRCILQHVDEYKKVVCPKKNYQETISNMKFWIIYISVQMSFFCFVFFVLFCFFWSGEASLGRFFNSCVFFFQCFVVGKPWWSTFLLRPLPWKSFLRPCKVCNYTKNELLQRYCSFFLTIDRSCVEQILMAASNLLIFN